LFGFKKNLLIIISCLLVFSLPLFSMDTPIIAVNDLEVNSNNSKYSFIGKGFSEIISYELRKSSALKIIDREKRNELMEEMKFSLSGMADEAGQIELGKLLTAGYLIYGEIVDMGDLLLINLQMVDVDTSEVVWNEQVTEPGGKYSYIGAYFAKSILDYFDKKVDVSIEKAIAAAVTIDAAVVVALSDSIDAMDKGNNDEAIELLSEVKVLDPENEIVSYFLGRLASVSARFKVVPERYVPYYNPAYLGGMEKDRLSLNIYNAGILYGEKDENNNAIEVLNPSGEYGAREGQRGCNLTYSFPVNPSVGAELNYLFSMISGGITDFTPGENFPTIGNNMAFNQSLFITFGVKLNSNISIGGGINTGIKQRSYYLQSWPLDEYRNSTSYTFGGLVAALVNNNSGSLTWDFEAAYGVEDLYWYDPVVDKFNEYGLPLYIEQTFTYSFNQRKTILALKQANDIYLDRILYYGRIMPVMEHRFTNSLSLRAGVEGSLFALENEIFNGYGATLGSTIKVFDYDIDLNFTFRMRPSRTLEDTIIPEGVAFITISKQGLFFK